MKNAAHVLTVEKLRKYLNGEKFGFNKKNFTFNVDGINHNFSQESLRLALDGNLMVKETGKDPVKIHVFLSNYNWNINKHNLPIYVIRAKPFAPAIKNQKRFFEQKRKGIKLTQKAVKKLPFIGVPRMTNNLVVQVHYGGR
jgi:hypothetical protein